MIWGPFVLGPIQYMKRKRQGILRISMEAIESLLDLPEDAHIKHARVDSEMFGVINLFIDSPLMPEVREGEVIPTVTLKEIKGWDE
jgi:hypothetical protein